MNAFQTVDAVIAGDIFFETIINKHNAISLNKPGGAALYAAAGFALWGKRPGILSKISEDKPLDWTESFREAGCDTRGIRKIFGAFDQVRFYAVTEDGLVIVENPQKFFSNLNQPLPKFLLGYEPPHASRKINRAMRPSSIKVEDIIEEYLQVNHLLITPTDLYTHSMLPTYYRSKSDGHVLLCGSASYMQPAFWYEFPPFVRGAEVFITTEDQLKRLFYGKSEDVWAMIEFVAQCGVEIVAVYSASRDHFLFDHPANLKYRIPRFTVDIIDPIGAFPTFCGAFTSGYITHFDPLESAIMGSVSAGISQEGSTPLYTMQTLPDLARMRLETIRDRVVRS